MVNTIYLFSFVEANIIISTDEDPSLRIESSAIINLRGVSTKLNKYKTIPVQFYCFLVVFPFFSTQTCSFFLDLCKERKPKRPPNFLYKFKFLGFGRFGFRSLQRLFSLNKKK